MKRNLYRLVAFVFATVSSCVCVGQNEVDKVDSFVATEMQRQHIPALSVAVVKENAVLLTRGYGTANLELEFPASSDTVYQLASVTKPITAMAVMTLVEDGKLSLSDEIGTLLDELPMRWKQITIQQLLSHTSGIKNFTEAELSGRRDHTPQEVLAYVSSEPLVFPSGFGYGYSNTNFFLLGMLIEKTTGKTFGDYLQERIFQPSEMTKTRMNDLHSIIAGRAQGYGWNGTNQRIGDYHSPTLPFSAGGLVTTVTDMSKMDIALTTGTLLKQETLESMWKPAIFESDSGTEKAEYGLGWQITEQQGVRMVGHGGGIPGFSSFYLRLRDKNASVIVLMNQESADPLAVAAGIVGVLGLAD